MSQYNCGQEESTGYDCKRAAEKKRPAPFFMNQQCHYLQRVTGFDLWGANDLTFVAQPVLWFGKLAKVVLVGVRYKDRKILNAQLEQIAPVMIGESYQVI
jgi:hypothetical protein